jgi:hypothetical protein
MIKRKLKIRVFKSHEEQEKADITYYRRLDPNKKVENLIFIRNQYFYMKYGRIPRLKRVYKVTYRKQS